MMMGPGFGNEVGKLMVKRVIRISLYLSVCLLVIGWIIGYSLAVN